MKILSNYEVLQLMLPFIALPYDERLDMIVLVSLDTNYQSLYVEKWIERLQELILEKCREDIPRSKEIGL